MKLIVITGAVHFDKAIEKILDKSNVAIYSRSDISGHKKREDVNLSENWFAGTNGYQQSVMFFAFTEKEIADKIMTEAKEFNKQLESESPLRTFLLAVENYN